MGTRPPRAGSPSPVPEQDVIVLLIENSLKLSMSPWIVIRDEFLPRIVGSLRRPNVPMTYLVIPTSRVQQPNPSQDLSQGLGSLQFDYAPSNKFSSTAISGALKILADIRCQGVALLHLILVAATHSGEAPCSWTDAARKLHQVQTSLHLIQTGEIAQDTSFLAPLFFETVRPKQNDSRANPSHQFPEVAAHGVARTALPFRPLPNTSFYISSSLPPQKVPSPVISASTSVARGTHTPPASTKPRKTLSRRGSEASKRGPPLCIIDHIKQREGLTRKSAKVSPPYRREPFIASDLPSRPLSRSHTTPTSPVSSHQSPIASPVGTPFLVPDPTLSQSSPSPKTTDATGSATVAQVTPTPGLNPSSPLVKASPPTISTHEYPFPDTIFAACDDTTPLTTPNHQPTDPFLGQNNFREKPVNSFVSTSARWSHQEPLQRTRPIASPSTPVNPNFGSPPTASQTTSIPGMVRSVGIPIQREKRYPDVLVPSVSLSSASKGDHDAGLPPPHPSGRQATASLEGSQWPAITTIGRLSPKSSARSNIPPNDEVQSNMYEHEKGPFAFELLFPHDKRVLEATSKRDDGTVPRYGSEAAPPGNVNVASARSSNNLPRQGSISYRPPDDPFAFKVSSSSLSGWAG